MNPISISFTPMQWEAIRTAIDYANIAYCKPNNHEVMEKVYTAIASKIKYEVDNSQNNEEK